MREVERKKDPSGDRPLSHAFERCRLLLEQCIHSQIMFSVLYPQLVAHIYGYVEDEAFSMEYYYWVLVDSECRCSALSEIF